MATHIQLNADFIQELMLALSKLQRDPTLYALGQKIVAQIKALQTSGITRQPTNYWLSRFPTSNSQGYITLRKARGSAQTIQQYHRLQMDIEQFLGLFFNKDVTSYVLYYEDQYGNVMRTDLSNVDDGIIESIYNRNRAQLITLSKEARNTLQNLESTINLTNHIERYTIATKLAYPQEWRGSVSKTKAARQQGKRARYNLGHVMEAFETHYQKMHNSVPIDNERVDWTDKELIQNIKDAMGNTPWYSSGDVGNKQVKFLSQSGSVSTGSQISVEVLGNFIVKLMSEKYTLTDLKNIAISVYNGINNQGIKLGQKAEQTIESLIKNSLQNLNLNIQV